MLNFAKCFFSASTEVTVIFIFPLVYVVCHIDLLMDIGLSLHPWHKPYLIMMY